jgi:hypothetical protein
MRSQPTMASGAMPEAAIASARQRRATTSAHTNRGANWGLMARPTMPNASRLDDIRRSSSPLAKVVVHSSISAAV